MISTFINNLKRILLNSDKLKSFYFKTHHKNSVRTTSLNRTLTVLQSQEQKASLILEKLRQSYTQSQLDNLKIEQALLQSQKRINEYENEALYVSTSKKDLETSRKTNELTLQSLNQQLFILIKPFLLRL